MVNRTPLAHSNFHCPVALTFQTIKTLKEKTGYFWKCHLEMTVGQSSPSLLYTWQSLMALLEARLSSDTDSALCRAPWGPTGRRSWEKVDGGHCKVTPFQDPALRQLWPSSVPKKLYIHSWQNFVSESSLCPTQNLPYCCANLFPLEFYSGEN